MNGARDEAASSVTTTAVVRIEPDAPERRGTSTGTVVSTALLGLLVLAVLYVTTFMVPILMGILLAAMLKLMFAPVVEWLHGIGIPRVISSLVVVASIPVVVCITLMHLAEPVSGWL